MLLKCLECNYKYGNIACLKYHYESCHKDKTDKCMCGNIILSGICAKNFSKDATDKITTLVFLTDFNFRI